MKKLMIIVLLLMPAAEIRADLYLKTVNHMASATVDGRTQPAADVPYEMWVGPGKLAGVNYNGPNVVATVILDFERMIFVQVNHQARTYMEIPLPLERSRLESAGLLPMFSGTADVVPLGEQKQIGPWLCDGYRLTMKVMGQERSQTVWTTKRVSADLSRYLPTYERRHEMHFLDPDTLSRMRIASGFQVRNEFDIGGIKGLGEIKVMEERIPPPGIYSIPQGYRRQESFAPGKSSGSSPGLKTPGMTPELLTQGIKPTGFMERDVAVSPDGKEIYYGFSTGRHNTILVTRLGEAGWSEPEIAPFASDERFYHFEPAFSPDGKRIYFLTTRPPAGQEPKPRWTHQNIWAAERLPDGRWSEPFDPDPAVINAGGLQYFPSLAANGALYFTRVDPKSKAPQICRSRPQSGKFGQVEILPAPVNRPGVAIYNACIAPDESCLVACVDEGSPAQSRYVAFFRAADDRWSEGIVLGPEINLKGSSAISASFSSDGRIFFFAAQRTDPRFAAPGALNTLNQLLELMGSPLNGNYDIYWVDARAVTSRK